MRRHEFEPAKLAAGLVLLTGALLGGLDAAGQWHLPDWLLLTVVPPGLALAALIAAGGYVSKRAHRRAVEARDAPRPDLGDMPMEQLRREHERRFGVRD